MDAAIASEGSGYFLKEEVKKALAKAGYEMIDVGQQEENGGFSYVDAGRADGLALVRGQADRAIVFCGTGAGVSLAANKVKGGPLRGVRGTVFRPARFDSGYRERNRDKGVYRGRRTGVQNGARAFARVFWRVLRQNSGGTVHMHQELCESENME